MTERDEKVSSRAGDALTSGCLLLLVLLADAAAGLLAFILLAVRGWRRVGAGAGQTAAAAPPPDWVPLLCFGALALAVGVTGVLLLRVGHLWIGSVQLIFCAVVAGQSLASWP